MDKLLKYRQSANNPFIQELGAGIFDLKSYKKAIDQISYVSIDQYMPPKYKKQLSFTQYNRTAQHAIELQKRSAHKAQIKPHQTRSAMSKITDMIKYKCQAEQVIHQQKRARSNNYLQMIKQKKISYSAYLNERKKKFQYQSSLALTQSINQNKHNKDLSMGSNEPKLSNCEKQLIILQNDRTSNHEKQLEDHLYIKDGYNTQNAQLRLSGLIIKKKMHPIDIKKDMYNEMAHEEVKAKRVNVEQKGPTFRRGFITFKMKREHQSNLIVSNCTTVKNKPKVKKVSQTIDPLEIFTKNFVNQKNLGQEDISLYPSIQIVEISKAKTNFMTLQEINAKQISVIHFKNQKGSIIYSYNDKERVQIASITKIMTCLMVIVIADRFCLDIKKEKTIISQRASKMPGTSAKLSYSDTCTIYQLLHGLMLPSGNDAAIALGQWGGKIIKKYTSYLRRMGIGDKASQNQKSCFFLNTFIKKKSYVRLFVHHMNKLAKFLSLTSTFFVNTHGLMNERAYSCSDNIALLTYYAMKNKIFKQIVGKQQFRCKIFNRTFSHAKDIAWQNTNKLLSIKGFKGVKTGITPSAGPCLSSLFTIDDDEYFIITLLKTKSCQMRFKQTINILKSILRQFQSSASNISNGRYKHCLLNLEKYDKIEYKANDQQQNENNFHSQQTNSNEDNEKSQMDENYNLEQHNLYKSYY